MLTNALHVGLPRNRIDGPAKVTGQATYAAEFAAPDLAHGYIVGSSIAKGAITHIDVSAAEAVAGVLKIFTHENRPRTAWFSSSYQDQVGPPGKPFRPLYDETVLYSGQPIVLVVAETFEIARYAASLVRIQYAAETHKTDLQAARHESYEPSSKRFGMAPPSARGDAVDAFGKSDLRISQEYTIAAEYHNPMEPHATTVVWHGDDTITIHDKTQGVLNSQAYVASVFGLSKKTVRVISPFVGGGFGSGLRPQHQLFLAVMASLELKRSMRVELTREQMFSHVHRAETVNVLSLGADKDGRLNSVQHHAVAATSQFEDHQEVVVNWSGLLYKVDNASFQQDLAKLDIYTPGDMRAPGVPLGMFALESAIDELAIAADLDPIELRLINYTDTDQNSGKILTSKELRACYRQGAERFGWSKRNPVPGSMREGRELIGWGMASGVWEAYMFKTSARVTVSPDGKLEIACATSDIGTGTYTILAQIGADELGLAMGDVTVKLGDTSLPDAPVQGGSWTAASAGSAVMAACETLRGKLLGAAGKMPDSPFAKAKLEETIFITGRMALKADPSISVPLADIIAASDHSTIEAEETVKPSLLKYLQYSSFAHSAVFAEVRIDEDLGVIRVTRVVSAVAAGRILNPKTARSQIIGGVVWGVGMALHEEAMTDHNLGRIMNRSLAEYHVPVNADIHDIDVIFVDEVDTRVSPIGVKGLGEIGIVGTAAAIANAVHHATGKRIRSLPITIDKLLD
jgi:xanthine dehydrogenase YagR molybdenum-binding subunit